MRLAHGLIVIQFLSVHMYMMFVNVTFLGGLHNIFLAWTRLQLDHVVRVSFETRIWFSYLVSVCFNSVVRPYESVYLNKP